MLGLNQSTPTVPTNIEDLFTWEDFVGSGSPVENQDAHAILLPQLILAQDSQQPAATAVSFAAPDSYTNPQFNGLNSNLSTPTLAQSTGISFPLQPGRDDPHYFSDAGWSSSNSTSSLPSTPGYSTPILNLPTGKGPEEDLLGHASTSDAIGGELSPILVRDPVAHRALARAPESLHSIGIGPAWHGGRNSVLRTTLGAGAVAFRGRGDGGARRGADGGDDGRTAVFVWTAEGG